MFTEKKKKLGDFSEQAFVGLVFLSSDTSGVCFVFPNGEDAGTTVSP